MLEFQDIVHWALGPQFMGQTKVRKITLNSGDARTVLQSLQHSITVNRRWLKQPVLIGKAAGAEWWVDDSVPEGSPRLETD